MYTVWKRAQNRAQCWQIMVIVVVEQSLTSQIMETTMLQHGACFWWWHDIYRWLCCIYFLTLSCITFIGYQYFLLSCLSSVCLPLLLIYKTNNKMLKPNLSPNVTAQRNKYVQHHLGINVIEICHDDYLRDTCVFSIQYIVFLCFLYAVIVHFQKFRPDWTYVHANGFVILQTSEHSNSKTRTSDTKRNLPTSNDASRLTRHTN